MEKITLEQIDLLMERANVSYTDAKEALEHANGDIVDALLYLEQNNKMNTKKNDFSKSTSSSHSTTSAYKEKATSFIKQLHATSFQMKKGDRTFIDVPATIASLALIICMPFSFLVLLVAIICGIKINVIGQNDVANKINSTFDSMQH